MLFSTLVDQFKSHTKTKAGIGCPKGSGNLWIIKSSIEEQANGYLLINSVVGSSFNSAYKLPGNDIVGILNQLSQYGSIIAQRKVNS